MRCIKLCKVFKTSEQVIICDDDKKGRYLQNSGDYQIEPLDDSRWDLTLSNRDIGRDIPVIIYID